MGGSLSCDMQVPGHAGALNTRDWRAGSGAADGVSAAGILGGEGMKKSLVALLGVFAMATTGATAQQYMDGAYDGRAIPGWTYSQEWTANAGLPTWLPASGGSGTDGANCNIGAAAVGGSRAEFMRYFEAVTPQSFMQQLRAGGTDAVAGHLTEVIDIDGFPAMRNILTARASGQVLNFVIVSIGAQDRLITLTCAVMDGGYLNRVQDFYDFADGVTLLASPPR